MLTTEGLLIGVLQLAALIVSLSFHEAAHAAVATWRGDSTARDAGRLTLNPVAHTDVLGTLVLPMLAIFASAPVLGWAKPVPVDLSRVRSRRWDGLLISLAGPASNFVMCAIFVAVALFIGGEAFYGENVTPVNAAVWRFVESMVFVNAALGVFNALPLPPLDGASIVSTLLPQTWADKFERAVAPYGFVALMILAAAGMLKWIPLVSGAYVLFVRQVVAQLLPGVE